MLKIALAQINCRIGDFEKNIFTIRKNIQLAREANADLVVFPELCVCGYPPRDFLEFDDFISKCKMAVDEIAKDCTGIAAIVGAPSVNPKPEGKNLFNSAYFLADGKIKQVVSKGLLPNYDVFDEYRYFEPTKDFRVIDFKGVKIALTICEDLWNVEDDPLYTYYPMDELMKQQPQLMINIAASPFNYAHKEERIKILQKNVERYRLPLLYVNHVGAHTELIFDGGSFAMDAGENLIGELKYFSEDIQSFGFTTNGLQLSVTENRKPETENRKPFEKIERIHNALILGIRDYFHKQNFQKAILGLSGGIDSAIVTVLAERALGKENVTVALMPSQFSSFESVTDSLALCKNLGVHHELIPIEHVFAEYTHALRKQFNDLPFNVAEENLQARIRGVLLMALSNKFGYILLNTSNKSELAVGYGTLYGDMCGGLSVIGDVYKTEIYQLAGFINSEKEIIPKNIIEKQPSAELRPDQKDSDSLPPYDLLDSVLHLYIEHRKGPNELMSMGFDEAVVKKVLRLVNMSEYKRYQTPPILRVSPKAFGMGRRLPIVAKYLS